MKALPLAASTSAAPVAAQTCPLDGENAPLALHQAWIMTGWERKEGDPPFVFAERMKRYYDLTSPQGVFYDNFAPGATQLFDNAAVYGANWQDLQNGARSILHALTGGHDQIVSDTVASTTVGFVGKIDRLSGEAIAFHARSQLGWVRTDAGWKIHHELNYAWVVEAEDIEHYFSQGAAQ
jgi:hypothetical protein